MFVFVLDGECLCLCLMVSVCVCVPQEGTLEILC